jgi:uncharacterized protein (TIGR03086 family)
MQDTEERLMAPIDDLEAALANMVRIMQGVRPDQWSLPTPCSEWDVRALANHSMFVAETFGLAAQGLPPASERDADILGDEPAAQFERLAKVAVGAWRERGTDGTVKIPFGEVPAAAAVRIETVDTFVHSWDLARATGQDARLDDALGIELLEFTRSLIPESPRGGAFGPVVPLTDDAPGTARLLAYSGRTP